jgi:hypothetical protein
MKNKNIIIIAGTSIIVVGILYLAIKKSSIKNVENDPQLKLDYEEIIKKIDNAKK